MKKSIYAVALCAAVAQPAFAADAPASPNTFTANVALVSDYRFRGISQSYTDPAIQGGFDYSHASGVYLGTWGSSVSGNEYVGGNGMEWDYASARIIAAECGARFLTRDGSDRINARNCLICPPGLELELRRILDINP